MAESSEKMRVLVADDDEGIRTLLKFVLTTWGYEVVEARDGQGAWDALMNYLAVPHLALLDWDMPEIDGVELCRRVRDQLKSRSYVYLILITGKGQASDVVQALNAGADDYIRKPLDTDELRSRVNAGARIVEYEKVLREEHQRLEQQLQEQTRMGQRMVRLNEALLHLSLDHARNVDLLLRTCGEMLRNAACIYYTVHGTALQPVGAWNVPGGRPLPIDLDGSLCKHIVLSAKNGAVETTRHVQATGFARTDPRVQAYNVRTHIGLPVFRRRTCVGCLSVMFTSDLQPEPEQLQTLQILATALAAEEERAAGVGGSSGGDTPPELANIAERSRDAILVVDADGIVRYVNPAGRAALGGAEAPVLDRPCPLPMTVGLPRTVTLPSGQQAKMWVAETEWNRRPVRLAVVRSTVG